MAVHVAVAAWVLLLGQLPPVETSGGTADVDVAAAEPVEAAADIPAAQPNTTPAPTGDTAVYLKQIKPVLKARCVACHGPLKAEAGLRLDSGAGILKGSENGPVVVAADLAQSRLWQRVSAADASGRMPPEGEPLAAAEQEALKAWIEAGAAYPADDAPEADPLSHWAFVPPVLPEVVAAADPVWNGHPIDQLIFEQYQAKGLVPGATADSATLIRRIYLDLLGIPPRPEEVIAFLHDKDPDAYERLIERLLASPLYGERFARHWMDVWRYSDWYGRRSVPDVMNSYPHIWRWRDWIVQSHNADLGYDQMITEMLAADEASPTDARALPATGFLVRNWFKWNYNTWMKDNVEHTAKAFLGLTLNCAHCHDHKYDPITNDDYFRFRACFEPLELRHDRVAGLPDPGPFKKYVYAESYGPISAGMIRVFDEKLTAETFRYTGGDSRNVIPNVAPVLPGAPASLAQNAFHVEPVSLPPEAYYPGLKAFVREEERAKLTAQLAEAERTLAAAQAALEQAKAQWASATAAAVAHTPNAPAEGPAAQQPQAADSNAQADAAMVSAAQAAMEQAQWTFTVEEAGLQAAQSAVSSLNARIAADDAKYLQAALPEQVEGLSKQASLSERELALFLAKHRLATAGRSLDAVRRKASGQSETQAEITAAEQALSQAQTAVAEATAALPIESANYTPLSPLYPTTSTGRRLALARWIARRENPLTARVAVNHVWQWHFGRPIVTSTYDFGRNGQPPSHPKVLDLLAVELMSGDWQFKRLHKLILTSRVYQLASSQDTAPHTQQNLAIDPDNRYFWRFTPARMESEVVRDSLLATSGRLELQIGGQELEHGLGLTTFRRSLYYEHHGEQRMEFLELFDAANPVECYRRTSSIVPQQALAMFNGPLAVAQARHLARRLWQQPGRPLGAVCQAPLAESAITETEPLSAAGISRFVDQAFWQVLSREPTLEEMRIALDFWQKQRTLFTAQPPAGGTTIMTDTSQPAMLVDLRIAENLIQALYNHHEFVTVR